MGPEHKIQSAVMRWAEQQFSTRLIMRKIQSHGLGSSGWEDVEFLTDDGGCFHVEFKAPGETPTPLQAERHRQLRAINHIVYVVDDVDIGRITIAREMAVRAWRMAK